MAEAGKEAPAADESTAPRRWFFGSAVLDERTLELAVAGEAVAIERKPLEVLLFLLHHAGEVVTKDEILSAVWPGRVLSDSALTSTIGKLREALRDTDQAIIRTQHGYGYRLIAEVKVTVSSSPAPPRFDFKAGDKPPLRPLWSLVERLGTGGHGEAWLARHDKTRETRVFKFAADTATLASLKREITLYRLLHDSLPARRDFVEILDWNLEEPPFFIESEHLAGGNMAQWLEKTGGLAALPLERRLELVAEIADALAAAHSVGVLHKDLKASNVLIDDSGAEPHIKLCDFGSGGVLDPGRLEQLGITRMGFTKAAETSGHTSGTPLYLAPEVVAGQPFSALSDIYALGVMLYQLAIGDLHKPMAPGWELEVEDELLREDIAAAAAGNPAKRLPDASLLAHRLRSRDERARQRAAERAQRAELDRQQRALDRYRAQRRWIIATIATLVVGVAATTTLYLKAHRSQIEAERSAMVAQAVNEFLNISVIGATDPGRGSNKNVNIEKLLDRAARNIPEAMESNPAIAARIHDTLGISFLNMRFFEKAEPHLQRAADLYSEVAGERSPARARMLQALVEVSLGSGKTEAGCARAGDFDRGGSAPDGPEWRARAMISRAICSRYQGRFEEAVDLSRKVLAELESWPRVEPQLEEKVLSLLAINLWNLGRSAEGLQVAQRLLEHNRRAYGDDDPRTASAHSILAGLAGVERDWQRAADEAAEASRILHDTLDPPESADASQAVYVQTFALVGLGRLGDAAELNDRFFRAIAKQRLERSADALLAMTANSILLEHQGRCAELHAFARKAHEQRGHFKAPEYFWLSTTLEMQASCLRREGRIAEARKLIDELKKIFDDPPPSFAVDFYRAHALRAEGLQLLAEGHRDEAIKVLQASADTLFKFKQRRDDWWAQRIEADLARAWRTAPKGP